MEINVSWEKWTEILRAAMDGGEFIGLSEEQIKRLAYRFGGFFAEHIDSANPEQRLLQKLWMDATKEERQALVSMLIKVLNRDELKEKQLNR
ncbi:MAG: DUF3243 family protein [Dethiobacter sp.]|nr:DUF3243 family protein [Dethiobacter sp.]